MKERIIAVCIIIAFFLMGIIMGIVTKNYLRWILSALWTGTCLALTMYICLKFKNR